MDGEAGLGSSEIYVVLALEGCIWLVGSGSTAMRLNIIFGKQGL